ncbi:MAG: hypothetical protein QOJ30_4498 [Pseudonocardiales bacterium]|jgi:hypothetical protein|nr:hypothetical protein [Pseudonocardiales bacterium]
MGKRLVEYRWLDWPFAALLTSGHVALAWSTGRFDVLRTTGFTNRLSLYTDMIAVTGLLFGFTATALASYLAFSGPRITQFRAYAGDQVHAQWMSALGGLAAALGILILCKVFDRDGTSAAGMRWIAEGTLFFASGRLIRLIWVFRQLIGIATKPVAERGKRSEPVALKDPPLVAQTQG